jgi:hypothetical protein
MHLAYQQQDMAGQTCQRCKYYHPNGQTCPYRLFQVSLVLKDNGRHFGSLFISQNTENKALARSVKENYKKQVGVWTRSTRFYRISSRLWTV